MKRVVFLNAGADTAGVGIGFKRAFDHHAPDWEARAVCRHGTYLEYPTDIVWPMAPSARETAEVLELVREADVVHVLDHEYALNNVQPALRRQRIVVHHLGTNFRRDPARVYAYARHFDAVQVTDSLDLMLYPDIAFLPVPADLDAIAAIPRQRVPRMDGRVRIAHAPTNRAIKSTDLIIATIEALAQVYPIDVDLIERVSNRECLERKAQADIYVDQLTIGFGLNFIECAAMGIPVVSGLVDAAARAHALAMWGRFPWADCTAETLAATIESLVIDPARRASLGAIGKAHVYGWHAEDAVVRRTLDIYEPAAVFA